MADGTGASKAKQAARAALPPQAEQVPRWVATAWQASHTATHDDAHDEESGLNAAKIVAAAIELADEHGIAALSIRKLAGRLGAGTMAAYRHIESRDDLVILMVDAALGAPPASILETDAWTERTRRWSAQISKRYARHPWLVDAPIDGLVVTPNRALWLEYILQALEKSGLSLRELLDAALLIDGHARSVAGLTRAVDAQDPSRDVVPAWLGSMLTKDRFPMLSEVVERGALDESSARDLDFGLERIIAGIGALAAR
jgi:AcrR family transcriptional regulator